MGKLLHDMESIVLHSNLYGLYFLFDKINAQLNIVEATDISLNVYFDSNQNDIQQ